jgi:ABC-type lipoprotein export system ATPase subunit
MSYALQNASRTWMLGRCEVQALAPCDLRFEPGVSTAVIGPSGSGKSTLLQVAALLDPPSTGGVWHQERCLSSLSDEKRSAFRLQHIGFVHQNYPMIASLDARDNVALPALFAGRSWAEARDRAQTLLESLALGAFAPRDVGTLSGGERQRVAIARALVNDPLIVFADEPTAALDGASGERVLALLFAVADRAALVVASHDTRVAEHADRVVHLEDGRVS